MMYPPQLGLYRTSRPVRKSVRLSKSGLSGNRTFAFSDAGLLTFGKKEKKKPHTVWSVNDGFCKPTENLLETCQKPFFWGFWQVSGKCPAGFRHVFGK